MTVKKTDNKQKDGRHKLTGPGPGRPKGSTNKFTDLKDEFLKAFHDEDGIGGAEGIKKLIKDSSRNKIVFLQMITKMLPSNMGIEHSGQIDSKLTIKVVKTK
ncbi:hypothetical protein KA005_48395 [bacterium]|nr:hypothetical protein [bacterium]